MDITVLLSLIPLSSRAYVHLDVDVHPCGGGCRDLSIKAYIFPSPVPTTPSVASDDDDQAVTITATTTPSTGYIQDEWSVLKPYLSQPCFPRHPLQGTDGADSPEPKRRIPCATAV